MNAGQKAAAESSQVKRSAQHLVIIGAGAKGVAVAAHVAALHALGHPHAPILTVIERTRIGSLWDAGGGFSDGQQGVCTSPEHDLGFPYHAIDRLELPQRFLNGEPLQYTNDNLDAWRRELELFPGLAAMMSAKFSFKTFLQEGPDGPEYAQWVIAGRPNFTHRRFREYLDWAMEKAIDHRNADQLRPVELHRSTSAWRIERDGDGWLVHVRGPSGSYPIRSNGVMITGNGRRRRNALAASAKRLEEGFAARFKDVPAFWSASGQRSLRRILAKCGTYGAAPPKRPDRVRIAVVGGGGAAAAVSRRIVQLSPEARVTVFGKRAVLHTRAPNLFEFLPYVDPTYWRALPSAVRGAFNDRLSNAVAWSDIADHLGKTFQVGYNFGDVKSVVPADPDGRDDFRLAVQCAEASMTPTGENNSFDMVIDAGGFDFESQANRLLHGRALKRAFESACEVPRDDHKPTTCFQLDGLTEAFPKLHVPDLCPMAGPAATNLLALGWLSTSILREYL